MLQTIDEIIEELEKNLEVERELGNRVFECDRSIFEVKSTNVNIDAKPSNVSVKEELDSRLSPQPVIKPNVVKPTITSSAPVKVVFIHHGELKGESAEIIEKAIPAMNLSHETSCVVWNGEFPPAKVYVVLGSLALRKWFPGQKGLVGQWFTFAGAPVMITYSPDRIFMFPKDSKEQIQAKKELWLNLREVKRRVE